MKISIVFSLIYVIVSSWCQDETVFHCSPKPGCQIAQCDPVAVGWDRPGFNIDEHLHDKEFPITCKSKNAEQPQNALSLFPFVSRNTMDIGSIKSELKELEGNSNKNAENIDALKRNYSDISNIKSEFKELEENVDEKMKSIHSFEKEISIIREIQNENAEQFAEIADLKQSRKEQSAEIVDLKQSRKEQSAEIRELKKDLVRLETMNNELLKELNEQKQTNNEMKKSMERIEEKLSATEKPRQVQSGNQQRPTTTTKTTLKPTPSPENCELKIRNICFFAVIRVEEDVNYDKAVDICKKRNADVGLIRDEESYNAIMDYLRKNILKGRSWIQIWTGIRFDPMVIVICLFYLYFLKETICPDDCDGNMYVK
uniref:uncharacterized protein LOC120325458 isoform X2 n=1 Tax=Styela clava TaxID=7725 RepID=UPI001939A538|nr:uncharacterized protein LOC120325458 isoform X2 [Styela clava]